MSVDTEVIRRLPKPFSVRDVESFITRQERLSYHENPSRIAADMMSRWKKQGLIREAVGSKSIPHYWGTKGAKRG